MGIANNTSKNLKKKADKADEKYMSGHPTRAEVGNYVNALLEEHYMPRIQGLIQMSSMVLQAILIKKNVCTGEELKEITEEFVKEQKRRTDAMEGIKSGELLKEVLTDDYVKALESHATKINKGEMSFQNVDIQNLIADHFKVAAKELKAIVDGTSELTDDGREAILHGLMTDKRNIESEEIKLSNPEHKPILIGMLWDAIIPFAHKQLVKSKDGDESEKDSSDNTPDNVGVGNSDGGN